MFSNRWLAFAFALIVLPVQVSAHLIEDGKGPVDAFNFDESQLPHLNEECAAEFECKPADSPGVFFHGCYYDVPSAQCQCSRGQFSQCNASASALNNPAVAAQAGKRDVLSSVVQPVAGFPLFVKLGAGTVALVILFFILSRFRNTASNNLRKALSLHKQAVSEHESGAEDNAKLLFEKANYHREQAVEQLKQKS